MCAHACMFYLFPLFRTMSLCGSGTLFPFLFVFVSPKSGMASEAQGGMEGERERRRKRGKERGGEVKKKKGEGGKWEKE